MAGAERRDGDGERDGLRGLEGRQRDPSLRAPAPLVFDLCIELIAERCHLDNRWVDCADHLRATVQ